MLILLSVKYRNIDLRIFFILNSYSFKVKFLIVNYIFTINSINYYYDGEYLCSFNYYQVTFVPLKLYYFSLQCLFFLREVFYQASLLSVTLNLPTEIHQSGKQIIFFFSFVQKTGPEYSIICIIGLPSSGSQRYLFVNLIELIKISGTLKHCPRLGSGE